MYEGLVPSYYSEQTIGLASQQINCSEPQNYNLLLNYYYYYYLYFFSSLSCTLTLFFSWMP